MALMLSIACLGLTASAAAFVFELNVWLQIALGVGVVVVAISSLWLMMNRRRQNFSRLFPTSLELTARATRAGESFEAALRIACEASAEPIKSEFAVCLRQLELGRPPAQVVEDLAIRIGTTDTHLFAHTVAIQQSLGGRLADSLERLARVIRDRYECSEKFKSVTGIGRYAVFAIVSMGLFVLAYMQVAEPEYIGKLVASPLGHKLVVYAIASELIGLVWVAITLNSEL
jgi:tight adherence protein B